MNRGLLGWGIFFIVFGAVPLAVRAGVIGESVVLRAWELWPLILVGIGLGLMLQRTRAAFVGGLVVAVTAGSMAGGVLAAGISGIDGWRGGFSACNVGSGSRTEFAGQRASFAGDATYLVELDCGEVDLVTAPGRDWTLTGSSPDGRSPEIAVRSDGLEVRTPDREGMKGFGNAAGVDWSMTLPQDPRTSLELKVNAGSAVADLRGLALSSLVATVNAGSAVLDLSSSPALDRITADVNAGSLSVAFPTADVTGELSANAGSIEICVPPGVDLRIRVTDNTLGSNNLDDEGLVQRGDTWESPGFGAGSATVDVAVSANLGSITLNPEDGCAK